MLFMEERSGKSMEVAKMKKVKKSFALTAIGMAAALSLSGCSDSMQTTEQLVTPKEVEQETEEDHQGSSQDTENSDTAVSDNEMTFGKETGIADQVQAPERYQADFFNDAIHVHVDAKVVIPMTAGFKLYKVTGRPFTQEDYDAVSHVLLKDASLWERDYEALEASNGAIKSEIETRIALLEEEAAAKGEETLTKAKEKTYAELIAEWEEMLNAAPEEAPIVEVEAVVPHTDYWISDDVSEKEKDTLLQEVFETNLLNGNATVDGEDYYVSLDNNWQNTFVTFSVRSNERGIGDGWISLEEQEVPTGLSREKVKEEAVALMNEMGFMDFSPAGEEYFRNFSVDEEGNGEVKKGNIGFGIHFTRTIEGIPVTYTHEYGNAMEDGEVTWPYEQVNFVFDDKGFTDFTWWNPYEIEKQSDEYVFLMPFSDIQDIFEEMILKKNEWIAANGDITKYIDIDEVRLGYMRIKDKTGTAVGTMIPVWDFFGSEKTIYADAGETYVSAGPYESRLTINAMDGTIIDRGLGY